MKKLLGIVVLGLLLSTNAYAGTLTYVCDFRGTPDQAVYEIKGNQVYEDGNLLETTFLKIDSQSVEFRHTYESYDPLSHTWGYEAIATPCRPEPFLLPRGKVTGGSSAINGQAPAASITS